jgi:molecular chaperone Hsp33
LHALELLGETVCASVLLTSNLKFRGSVSLQIQSSGAVRLLLGQCTHDRRVRGVVRVTEHGDTEDGRVPVLSINLEPEDGGQPYQGVVGLDGDGLAESLHEYFNMSEQLPTFFVLAAHQEYAAGLMLQKMPGETEDEDAWNRLTRLALTLTADELNLLNPRMLLHRIFHEENIRLFDPQPVAFGCGCSEEKVSGMLQSLGADEAWDIIREQGVIDVTCEYCGEKYAFDSVDVAQLFAEGAVDLPGKPGLQ